MGKEKEGGQGRRAQLRAGRRVLRGWAGHKVWGRHLYSVPATSRISDTLRSTEQPLKDCLSGKLAQVRPLREGGRRDSALGEVRRVPGQAGRGQ